MMLHIYVENIDELPHPRTMQITAWSDQTMQISIFHTIQCSPPIRVNYICDIHGEYTTETNWEDMQKEMRKLSQEEQSLTEYLEQINELEKSIRFALKLEEMFVNKDFLEEEFRSIEILKDYCEELSHEISIGRMVIPHC